MPLYINGREHKLGKLYRIWCDTCEDAESVVKVSSRVGWGGKTMTLCQECYKKFLINPEVFEDYPAEKKKADKK